MNKLTIIIIIIIWTIIGRIVVDHRMAKAKLPTKYSFWGYTPFWIIPVLAVWWKRRW